jgi:hypothetical protein
MLHVTLRCGLETPTQHISCCRLLECAAELVLQRRAASLHTATHIFNQCKVHIAHTLLHPFCSLFNNGCKPLTAAPPAGAAAHAASLQASYASQTERCSSLFERAQSCSSCRGGRTCCPPPKHQDPCNTSSCIIAAACFNRATRPSKPLY